ncbi:M13 family metallopeptidase [Enemella sp. A6]|uniref:M13 family metallopeptidase n=1 Tax=Enemella sp. A6 TaxID=3440152 RepID=UPI003EBF3EAE
MSLELNLRDPNVRPVDDLFRAANGGWLADTPIPDDKPGIGVFLDLRDAAEDAVRDIITGLSGEPGTDEARIADLFASYLDEDRLEELGATPLRDDLAAIEAIDDIDALIEHLAGLPRRGITSLIGLDIDADPGEPSRYCLLVGQSGLGLPDEEYYRSDEQAELREAYRAHIARSLALAGVPDTEAQADMVLDLETRIAAHHWDKVRTRDLRQMYNPMTLTELAESAPGLQWPRLLAGLGDADTFGQIVNAQPSYFTEVAALLVADELPAWQAWLRWHLIRARSPYLSKAFVDENFAFYGTTLSGTPALRERWRRGVTVVEGAVGEAVGKIYVQRHFRPEAKTRMLELVDNLLEAYRRSITELEWMTEATRAEALTKLEAFTPKIGYPDEWIDYSTLEIAADDLIGNIERAAAFEFDRQAKRIGNPIEAHEWLMTPQTVNAYYHPLRNEIVFPAAICQPPFFDPDADDALNYGAIGAVIGHEIGHGFDDQGSTCDGEGRLRDWWTDADREAFEDRTKVLIDQYAALSPEGAGGQKVNGELTIGENIGDLGGLGIAHAAYKIATEGTEVPEIDGMTGDQRFFWAWAVAWRGKYRPERVKLLLATDPHSPNEFRCNQVVRNLDAFHEAFGTTEADELWLAPEDRVTIW